MRLPTSSREEGASLSTVYRIAVPLLAVWLAVWIALSWPAIQDDAVIHLRYADNLYLHHFITYDGVHPNYGASSLLYVAILAALRGVSASANLARALSSGVHLILFAGLALAFARILPKRAQTARFAALVLMMLLVVPSAVRWLDDGMETGLVVLLVTLFAWVLHSRMGRIKSGSPGGWPAFSLPVLSFFAVLLRTELLLLCGVGFLILALGQDRGDEARANRSIPVQRLRLAMPTLAGAASALAVIVATMHTLLPDTAVAKARGIAHWFNPVHDTAVTLGGALSFGMGMPLLWLLTLSLVLARRRRLTTRTLLANCFVPVVLVLSSLRGQEIQGVRYFAWTFFFSMIWNILELAAVPESKMPRSRREIVPLYAFAGLLIAVLPFESVAMHRVLTHRADTVRQFEAQHLDVLRTRRGTASDIGYIGYFTQAAICDLAGLVNGRAAALMSKVDRARACSEKNPDFLFLNVNQISPVAPTMDLAQWQICGQYDFTNLTTPDTHYLIVRPGLADEVCRATGMSPSPIQPLLPGNASPR